MKLILTSETRSFWLVIFIILYPVLVFSNFSLASVGSVHRSRDKAWLGGGIREEISQQIHATIIDTVPCFSGNIAGGGDHRFHWGHTYDWFIGKEPSEKTIGVIQEWYQKKHGTALSIEDAIDLYKKYLPQGGGRELITNRLKRYYPRLARKDLSSLADIIFASHLVEDYGEQAPGWAKRILKRPNPLAMEAALKIDAMKVGGKDISTKAARFIHTPKNTERLSAIIIEKSEKEAKIYDYMDKDFIGIEKQGEKYLVCKGSKARVRKILRKFPKYNVMVEDSVFEKLQNSPEFTENIKAGQIIRESDVLSKDTVRKCGRVNLGKEAERIIAEGEGLYAASRLKGIYNTLPKNIRIASQAAGVATLFSAFGNSWAVFQGEKKIEDAVINTLGDGLHAGISLYLANAIIQNVGGGKYALTAIVDASTKELIPGVGKGLAATSAFLEFGVATFIFDQSRSVFFLIRGDIPSDKFFYQTCKNFIKSAASGVASMCAVAIGFSPAGPVVMAISVGSYMALNTAIAYAEKLNKRNYLFIEDTLGHLPLEMQNRITPWDIDGQITPWDRLNVTTPWDSVDRVTPWDRPTNPIPWD
ncbi:MAG: hypothetical protein ACFFCW_25550 [Candidatus Hodarchaeota archaeon]